MMEAEKGIPGRKNRLRVESRLCPALPCFPFCLGDKKDTGFGAELSYIISHSFLIKQD